MDQTPTGHTAQYLTLARALGYAAGLMEDDLEELTERGYTVSAASLRMEARFVTVTLLSAALAESLANTVLAMVLTGKPLRDAEWTNPVERWQRCIPAAIGCDPFIHEALHTDLKKLVDMRNAIIHSKPRIFVGENVIVEGSASLWDELTSEMARKFVALPSSLISAIPRTERFQWPLMNTAQDYWLDQAIRRGRRESGRSANQWRPFAREERSRGQYYPPEEGLAPDQRGT